MAKEKTAQKELPAADDMEGRKAALASALKQIEKDFGKGSIMRLGDA